MANYLLDTNIWLRSVQPDSPQHPQAIAATQQLLVDGHAIYLTAQNMIELWSVATRPTSTNGLGWPIALAQQECTRLQAQFPLLDESGAIFSTWSQLVVTHGVIGRRVHDARLVAVMLVHGLTHLLTFNHDDFKQFTEITALTPTDVLAAAQNT